MTRNVTGSRHGWLAGRLFELGIQCQLAEAEDHGPLDALPGADATRSRTSLPPIRVVTV